MVLQNGDAGRCSPGTIPTEAYSAETVSIQQEPRRKQMPRPALDSYYIEFPSLGESYSLPRRDVDADEQPLSEARGEKQEAQPTTMQQQQPASQKSAAMSACTGTSAGDPGQHRMPQRLAGRREVIGKNAEHGSSNRRAAPSAVHRRPIPPQPHNRKFVGSRAASITLANSGEARPQSHRSKQTLAVPAASQARPTSAPHSSSATGHNSSGSFTGRPPATATESTHARSTAGSLARLAAKPWKELEDCGVVPLYLTSAAERRSVLDKPARCADGGREGVAGRGKTAVPAAPTASDAFCDKPKDCFGVDVSKAVAAAFAGVDVIGHDALESLSGPADGGCSSWCGRTSRAGTVESEAGTTLSGTHVSRAVPWPNRCRCHLSWYNGECECEAVGAIDRGAPKGSEDDDVDCWVLNHRDAAVERDVEQCSFDDGCLLASDGSQETSVPPVPADGSDSIWAAATSRLLSTFVHPDRSERLATAVVKGFVTASSESAAAASSQSLDRERGCRASGEWPPTTDSLATCSHPWYHYEVFLDADCGASVDLQQRTRHCFDWTRYTEQPPPMTASDGIAEREGVGASLDFTGWPPPEPAGRCSICGCDVRAGPQQLPQDAAVFASLEQRLLQCLSQSPVEVEDHPAEKVRSGNDFETVAASADPGCFVHSVEKSNGAH